MRLDRALVDRGLARSRTHAQEMIRAGHVLVNSAIVARASAIVKEFDAISVADEADTHYVSRAAHKLLGALDVCKADGLDVAGRKALDAGASTGGFTQVLLEHGVSSVIALDVGHGQLSPVVADDARVTSVEGANVRELGQATEGAGVDLVVADLSFISLTMAVGPILDFSAEQVDLLLMVKPQFEVGKEALGSGGVVRSLRQRADAVASVVAHMREHGVVIHTIARSVLPGPAGNEEFFVWGSRAWQAKPEAHRPILNEVDIALAISRAVEGKS